jgi:hypothetical protein
MFEGHKTVYKTAESELYFICLRKYLVKTENKKSEKILQTKKIVLFGKKFNGLYFKIKK